MTSPYPPSQLWCLSNTGNYGSAYLLQKQLVSVLPCSTCPTFQALPLCLHLRALPHTLRSGGTAQEHNIITFLWLSWTLGSKGARIELYRTELSGCVQRHPQHRIVLRLKRLQTPPCTTAAVLQRVVGKHFRNSTYAVQIRPFS